MAGQFEGKVALITGAARGQGRSHAVRFAEEAPTSSRSISAIRSRVSAIRWPTREDLDETVNLVEKTGRRIVAQQVDVRDFDRLKKPWPKVWSSWAVSTSCSPTRASVPPSW